MTISAPRMYDNGWSPDYKISVVIPTRQRSKLLIDCLNSLLDKSYKDDRLFEVILLIDNDDTETLQTAIELQSKFSFINKFDNTECNSLLIMIVNRSEYMQRDYNNAGSVAAKGELVLVLNDDTIMNTENWDYIIYQFYQDNKTKDDIMMIAISDNTHNSNSEDSLGQIRSENTHGPCFPIVTKTFVNYIKGIFPSNIRMWGVDIILFKIFQNVDRVYRLYNISIDHNSFHTSSRDKDDINDYVADISAKPQYLPTIPEYIDYIQSIIAKKNNV
jgi:glycosyltransferase involved in cell wall biosynthesis